ncbi:MAG: AmmeMemoRadiSam system protein B [candidate division FCPU426 bacterium]
MPIHCATSRNPFFALRRTAALITLLPLVAALGCGSSGSGNSQIRPPAVAGAFYPDNAKELNALLKKAFQNAPPPKLEGDLKALLLPHAGYVYSGVITAIGMRALVKKDVDTVYVIGTSHYSDVGGALVWQGRAFRTPLGEYPVDLQAVRELLKTCPQIHLLPRAWVKEHSVEVQVPFLQKVAPKAKLVPILMGTATWEECWSVAEAIAAQAKLRKAVIIASTDLSHYPAFADANVIDRKMLDAAVAMDPQQLDSLDREIMSRGIPNLACTICGLSGLKTTLIAATLMGANDGQLLHYANSGDITDKKGQVVGYGAVAFVQAPGRPEKKLARPGREDDLSLTEAQKQELLAIARSSITEALATGTQLAPTTAQKASLERHPVFVTLRRGGYLQGCIGLTEARLPLYQAVAQMACAAAFEDPRFKPLQAADLPYTEIEISVLTPLKRISDPKEIVLGIHGVVVKRGDRSGLFLPQVATETGWSKEEFLNQLCQQKANLPPDAWRDRKTELYVFRVLSFQQPGPAQKTTPAK